MRLQLTKRSDYAIRACLRLALASGAERLPSRRIAREMAIPVHFLPQILADLVRGRFVEATGGKLGGYRLSRDPAAVTLLELIETIEGPARSEHCVLRDSACDGDPGCSLHPIWSSAQAAFTEVLGGTSLADIAAIERSIHHPAGRSNPERISA